MDEVSVERFKEVDMRVGRVVEVEDFPEATKPLYKLTIDFGEEIGVLDSAAGLVHYPKDELEGRLVVAAVNLPTRQISTFFSQCLVLGVPDEEGEVALLQVDGGVPLGARVF